MIPETIQNLDSTEGQTMNLQTISDDAHIDLVEDFEIALRNRRGAISGMSLSEHDCLLDVLEQVAENERAMLLSILVKARDAMLGH